MFLDRPTEIPLRPAVDDRGCFTKTFDYGNLYWDKGEAIAANCIRWLEDGYSVSRRGTIRGLHGDMITSKLITVASGEALIVCVEIENALRGIVIKERFRLSGLHPSTIAVPRGWATGMFANTSPTVLIYKQSTTWEQRGKPYNFRWDDPTLEINWPTLPADKIISEKDRNLPLIAEMMHKEEEQVP